VLEDKTPTKKGFLETLPRGTFAIASGMIVGAITGYVVVIVVNKAVGDRAYAGFGAFWSLIFVVGPGLFLPLEQEISRAISHRAAHKDGGAPIIRIAVGMAATLALGVALIFAALSPFFIEHVFHDNGYLQLGFIIGIIGYGFLHCSRGVLSGNHKFGAYGTSMALEGTSRFIVVLILAQIGAKNVGYYGLALGLAPFAAVLPFSLVLARLMKPGSPASKRELGTALTYLVSSSVLSQVLAYSSLFLTNVIEGGSGQTARYFTNAFFIARIPVIGFMAVQAALLPKLSSLHAMGEHEEFRYQFRRLLSLVFFLSVGGVVFIAAFGTPLGQLLFTEEKFQIPWSHFVVLSIGSCLFLLAQTLLQACIALQHYKIVTTAYLCGVAVLIATSFMFAATDIETTLWVSLSFSLGCVVVATMLYFAYEKAINALVQTEKATATLDTTSK
jgi:O-antigen/teichoic acid export membrane protein